MKTNLRPMLFVSLLFLVTGTGLLSACTSAGDTTSLDSRIAKLETDVQANGQAIATLQQQVAALTPPSQTTVSPTTPPSSTTPPATTPPASTTPTSSILPTSSVTISNLTLTPAEVNPGQTVTMSIDVNNKGTTEGSYKVVFIEKMVYPVGTLDLLEYTDLITLKPGETKKVTFTTNKNAIGAYSVTVGGLVGQYSVVAVPPPPPPPPSE